MAATPGKKSLLALSIAAGCSASVFMATPTYSQGMSLEEVVVTARKRTENLQDVPMAVSAFGSDQLRNAQVSNIVDIARMTPNVTLTETSGLGAGALAVFIRGIGSDPGFDQGVGIYLDDVYLNRTSGSLLEVYDVDRIEVLKGPQGNLYGRNTIGGAIKYVSREPGDELEANAEVKVGEFDLRQIKANISGPLIENTLYGGFGLYYKQRDGIQTNTFDGSEWWADDVQAYRGNLVWNATDSLKIKLLGDYSLNESDPHLPNRVAVDSDTLNQLSEFITAGNLLSVPSGLTTVANDLSLPADIDDVSTGYGDVLSDFEIETSTVALSFEWDISDSWLLKSVTAQRSMENTIPFDFDGSEQQFIETVETRESDDFSQEFQFLYGSDTVNAVFGLYYLDADSKQPGHTLQAFRLQGLSFFDSNKLKDDRDLESASAYFNVDWDFLENWQWSIGGRYTRDEKTLDQKSRDIDGYYGVAFAPGLFPGEGVASISPGMELEAGTDPNVLGWIQLPDFAGSFRVTPPHEFTAVETLRVKTATESWDEVSPSTKLSWHASDDIMLYGGVSTGFKSGGFNNSAELPTPYDPETVVSYSLGMKSDWVDGRLRLNGEIFYNDYTDKQLATISLDTITGALDETVDNVGEVTTTGAELELTWLSRIEGLVLGLNIGYLDAEVDSFKELVENPEDPDLPPVVNDKGDTTALGFSPRWTVQGRVFYDISLDSAGFLSLGADVSYRSQSYTNSPVDLTSAYEKNQVQKEHAIWNAMAAWRSADEHWRIALEGRNLEDTRVLTHSFVVGPFLTGGYNMPRTWALSLGYTY